MDDFMSMPRKAQKFAAPILSGSRGPRGRSISMYIASRSSRSYWLETVCSPTLKSSCARCFGIPQIPFPPFTETSVLTGRSITYWPKSKSFWSANGTSGGAGLEPCVQPIAMLNSM